MNYILTIYDQTNTPKYFVVQNGKPGRLVDTIQEAQYSVKGPHLVEEHVVLHHGVLQANAALTSVYHVYPDLYTALIDAYPLQRLTA